MSDPAWSARQHAALRRVAMIVAGTTSPEEVFATVAAEVGSVLGAEFTSMVRYESPTSAAIVAAWATPGRDVTVPVGTRLPVSGVNVHTLVFRTGRPARLDTVTEDVGPALAPLVAAGIRSAVGVPISTEGRLWGAVIVSTTRAEPLHPGTEARLAGFTELVAAAVANAQARLELSTLAAEQAALRRVATLVARGGPPAAVFATVAEETGRVLAADLVSIGRYDPDDTVTMVATWSATGKAIPVGLSAPVGRSGLPQLVRATSRPSRIDRYSPAMRTITYEMGVRAAVAAPITVAGRPWGMVAVATRSEDTPLPPGTEDRLAAFTELAATAIANAQAREELRSVADEQAALRRVATLVAQGASPGELFQAVCEEVGSVLGADATAIVRRDPDGEATIVARAGDHGGGLQVGSRWHFDPQLAIASALRTGRSARADDFSGVEDHLAEVVREMQIRSSVASPIVVQGRIWGAIGAGTAREPFPPDTEQRMVDFTELVATAIANADAQAELTASRVRVVATADETRRRIERDLHGGVQQRLVSLTLQLRSAQAAVPSELDGLSAELDRVSAGLISTLEELREFARGVHPAVLTEAGLAPALKTLARRSSVPVQLDVRTTARLPEHVEVTAYYVVSETLANVAKRASVSTVTVDVEAVGGVLSVSVRDNGGGGADLAGGVGLIGLKDRVEAIGGKLALHSSPGQGTNLVVQLPAG